MKKAQCRELVETVMHAHGNYMGGHENPAVNLVNFLKDEVPERQQVMFEFIHCLYVMVGEIEESRHCPHCGCSDTLLAPCPKCGKLLLRDNPDTWFHTCDSS